MFHKSIAAAALLALAFPADAALFVSGDSNIMDFDQFSPVPNGNSNFLLNISGANVLLQNSTRVFLDYQMSLISDFFTSAGIANSLVAADAMLTAADFSGRSLFIGYAPDDSYSAEEITAMASFLGAGGNVLLTGENIAISGVNDILNAALADLGSDMRIIPRSLDSGYNAATILTMNSATIGTDGFLFARTSEVTAGTALFGTLNATPFLAVEGLDPVGPAIPEPATWAMLIVGFGIVGLAARRRREIAARPLRRVVAA